MLTIVRVAGAALQSARQVRLLEYIARLVKIPILLKDAPRFRKLAQRFVLPQVSRVLGSQGEAFLRQLDRRRRHPLEGQPTVFLFRVHHAGDRTWNSDGLVADNTGVLDDIALSVEIHVRPRCCRGFLTIVNKMRLAVRQADKHEAATPEIPRL